MYSEYISRSHDRDHEKEEEDCQSLANKASHSGSKQKEVDELIYNFISFITNLPQADSVSL